jgi:hypothetical protein
VGAGIGSFLFCGALHTYLSPPNRPIIAEPELGYTHLFKAKHGDVYGTCFEYLVVPHGAWISRGIAGWDAMMGQRHQMVAGRNTDMDLSCSEDKCI